MTGMRKNLAQMTPVLVKPLKLQNRIKMKFRIRKPLSDQAARSAILERLKKAAEGRKVPDFRQESPKLYAEIKGSLVDAFRENAEKVNAEVTLFRQPAELISFLKSMILENDWKEIVCPEKKIRDLLKTWGFEQACRESVTEDCDVAITGCEHLIGNLGSVLVSSAQAGSRQLFVYPPVHLVVADSSQLVETLEEGYRKTLEKYNHTLPSMITTITGPSRTADIEKTLVLGAHGPKKLHIFILNGVFR
jgi:L-lactate dehydrogenase complex protein LldG